MNLLEASLARIWDHYQNKQFAVLTSWRQGNSQEENDENFKQLKADLKSINTGFIPLVGHGQESTPDGVVNVVEEPSLAVFPRVTPDDSFRGKIIEIGKKYKQWGLIVHTSKKETDGQISLLTELVTLDPEKVEEIYGSIHFNKIAKFYSELFSCTGNRTFNFENVLVEDGPHGNNLWLKGTVRVCEGEIFDDFSRHPEAQIREILEFLGK